ncbi:MAG TPA: calcium-binding protein [Actinoplanes sp.]|nr:calcium-binding protein [Actinoplanes sp.]
MSSRTWFTRAGIALLSTTAAIGVLAAPAQAASVGTASVVNGKLIFKAGSGKTNRVWLSPVFNGKLELSDRVAVKAGKGCKTVKGVKHTVRCVGVTSAKISLGSGNDVFLNRGLLTTLVHGGAGNDTLNGGIGRDFLYGEAGNDRVNGDWGSDYLVGGAGNDVIYGRDGADVIYDGAGNDRAYGGPGFDTFHDGTGKDRFYGEADDDRFVAGAAVDADRFYGGAGHDTATYQNRKKAVTLDADGKADDGAKGEKDNIATDVENLIGGAGNDRITGNNGPNYLRGGFGDDIINGLGGDDQLYGENGKDRLDGGAGDDRLAGDSRVDPEDSFRAFADVLIGGSGADTADYVLHEVAVTVDLDGAKGDDGARGEKDTIATDVENVLGGIGDDTLTGNNGNNVVNGGRAGADVLRGLGGDDTLLSDSLPIGESDKQVDILDGGAHVTGDRHRAGPEDTVVDSEIAVTII